MTTATAQYIADRVTDELGLGPVDLTPGNITAEGRQILALMNSLGELLGRDYDWQFLQTTATITGDGVSESFPMPANFGRIVNQTTWSSMNRLPMYGPLNAQEWGWVKYGIVSVGIYYRYRILNNQLFVFPTFPNGEVVNFFYISKDWVIDQDGVTYKDTIVNPNDTPVYDRMLMIKGLKNLLWGQKGFDTTSLAREFNEELANQMGQNQGMPVLNAAGNAYTLYITPYRNTPEGNW